MRAKDRRDLFFDTALKLIHKKGFKATTMRDIAGEMGFEVANVYNYIKSKQSILEESLFEVTDAFHKNIDHVLGSSYPPIDKLRAVIAFHIRLPYDKPYKIGLMLNEWRNLEGDKLQEFLDTRIAYAKKINGIIKAGIDADEIREMNVKVITNSILSTVRWLHREYTRENSNANPFELEKQITDYIFNGIATQN